ncbi:MAG TPA: Flp family type IVb pilin [Armatimonadetes bacterium]|nr:Flp family type IVb pilin [Armatimonadota bacterium]
MGRPILSALLRDEGGATVTEYAAIAALIIVGVIAILVILGSKLRSVFVTVNSHLPASSG